MKKSLFILFVSISIHVSAQNTFPSSGNVGVGTMTPSSTLELKKGGQGIKFLTGTNTSGYSLNIGINDDGINFKNNSTVRGFNFINEQGNLISILPDGNFGIGTNNPKAKLQISGRSSNWDEITQGLSTGTIHLDPNNTSNHFGNAITFGASDTSNKNAQAGIYVRSDGNYGTKMYFSTTDSYATGSKTAMSIDHKGNIGIGTANPLAKFHTEGQARFGTSGVLTADWTYQTNWGGSSNKWAGYIGFNASRNNEDTKDHYKGTNKYTSKGVFEGSNYGFRWLYRNHNNHDSDGQHQLTEFMRLANNGNLGIGTTAPDSKLTVKGKIHAEEVKIDLSVPAPDYVFKKEYNLLSIGEVQQHIKDNGHLPNIPSAKEMEKNGVELGIMNMKLLEKIEELTLYTIDQEQRIKDLEEKLTLLLKSK
ncbi:tail fiber protein [Aquimarina aggregata]|uniref:tail fiber protein n=1 Tax=Aquimarina aggregata TaxID=1642818 RepID=UPI0024920FD3|nr:tail fiber protein [Aquimarina aggregata]